jgi:hypothetical protein
VVPGCDCAGDFGGYVLVVVAPMILIEPNLDLGPFGDVQVTCLYYS